MSPAELLHELEPLTHDARIRRMVELGRAAAHDPAVAATIEALGRGGVHERMLALHACHGSRDGAHAARAASDSARLVRRRSLRLIALLADDAQALTALRAGRPDERLALLRHLRRRGRPAPADALMDELAAQGDEALGLLVGYGSAAAVARHIEAARGRGGSVFWSRLARQHPDLAARALRERTESRDPADDRLLSEANAALRRLADARPDEALRLVTALALQYPLGRIALDPLYRRRPAEVSDLLLGSEDTVSLDLGPVAHRLDDARLLALLERRPGALAGRTRWFLRLPIERRRAVFAAVGRSWRDSEGRLVPELAGALPRDLREGEGRRHLALPALATRPAERFAYASLLPWDEARRALDPWIGHPEGTLRAAALAALADAVRFHRRRLAEYLTMAQARRNEQDPVRLAMLAALVDLPPSCWRAEHLEDLARVIRAALDAADLSHATAGAAQQLVVRLLPRHTAWAATWLETLVRERGQVVLSGLEGRLTDGDVRRLAPSLATVLAAWQTRERESQLLSLATALGKRLRAFDALRDLLERVLRETRTQWVATSALALLARHDRARLASLVPALVADDPSWATQATVYLYLHRRRQDLITPFLGRRAYGGRFSTGKTRFVLPLAGGFFRWTPAQQETFAATLEEVTRHGDPMRDLPAVLQAIGQLAAMPMLDPRRLAELSSDPRLAVRDAALRALGRLDSDQGVPALMEALGDDRARVAIYALRRALLGMPAAHALDLLRVVPMEKVTVAKEVVRLVGEFPGDAAFSLLRQFAARPLHRDVRVALLRSFWGHLERPEAWDAFDQAAGEADPALLSGVVRIPADRLSAGSRRRLATLLVRLLAHPEPTVRLEVLRRCAAEPVGDPGRLLLARALTACRSPLPDERQAAAQAVAAACAAEDAARVAEAVLGLAADRRALRDIVRVLQAEVPGDHSRLGPVSREVLGALAADPLTARLQVDLAVATLTGSGLADWLADLAAADALHADALGAAIQAILSAASRPDAIGLDHLGATLAPSPDARLRRLALAALVARSGVGAGWDSRRLARLRAFRDDPSPLVAAAAQFTFPPEEVEVVLPDGNRTEEG